MRLKQDFDTPLFRGKAIPRENALCCMPQRSKKPSFKERLKKKIVSQPRHHQGGEREMKTTKEVYVQPVLTKHDLLRDITAAYSGSGSGGGIRDRIEDIVCRVFPRLPRCN